MRQVVNGIERGTLVRVLARAAMLWLLLRAVAFAVALAGRVETAPAPSLALFSSAIIIAAVGVMAAADTRALRERVFLANIGVSLPAVIALTVAMTVALEIAWSLLA